ERASVCFAPVVALLQKLRQKDAALFDEQFSSFVNLFVDLRAQQYFPDRTSGILLARRRKLKALQLPLLKPTHMADFVNVMVFRGHPEDRHSINPRARHYVCKLNRA